MSSSETSSPPAGSLSDRLRHRRTATLLADAQLIRDAPPSTERDDEARRSVREAMLLFALHRITRAERDRLLDILSFAIPPVPPKPGPPTDADSESLVPYDPFV